MKANLLFIFAILWLSSPLWADPLLPLEQLTKEPVIRFAGLAACSKPANKTPFSKQLENLYLAQKEIELKAQGQSLVDQERAINRVKYQLHKSIKPTPPFWVLLEGMISLKKVASGQEVTFYLLPDPKTAPLEEPQSAFYRRNGMKLSPLEVGGIEIQVDLTLMMFAAGGCELKEGCGEVPYRQKFQLSPNLLTQLQKKEVSITLGKETHQGTPVKLILEIDNCAQGWQDLRLRLKPLAFIFAGQEVRP